MDVGAPSNYERLIAMTGTEMEVIRSEMAGFASSDDQIKAAIREIYDKYSYISDPHSATGYNAACHYDVDGFWLATADAAKFGEVIVDALGVQPAVPERLARLLQKTKVSTPIGPDSGQLKDFVSSL